MRWQWLWGTAMLLFGLQILLASTASAKEQMNALSHEEDVQNPLSPHLRDVTMIIEDLIDIAKIGMGVADVINIISDMIFNHPPTDMERKMLEMFEALSDHLDRVEQGVDEIRNSMNQLADWLQKMVRWENALSDMENYILPIKTLYETFRLYQKGKDQIEDYTLKDFAKSVVSHESNSIMSLMAELHSMAAPEAAQKVAAMSSDAMSVSGLKDPRYSYHVNEIVTQKMILQYKLISENTDESKPEPSLRPSLFRMLQDILRTNDTCHLNQSPQQLMEGLHIILALTEAKGFTMQEFAYMVLRVHNEGNFTFERDLAKKQYMKYSADILNEAKSVMEQLSREYYRCDPQHHQEEETYVQLTELLQGYIENEVDMNADGSCSQTCGYYQHAKNEGCYMPSTQYCGNHSRCTGTIHDCRYYSQYAKVCVSQNPSRRIDSIEYEGYMHLGSQQKCEGTEVRADSWIRFPWQCSYCLCLCDDEYSNSSDRYISLVPAVSDLENNMVVTGVKFTKQRQVIHIQVQQGQVLPMQQINSTTIQWVETEPIQVKSEAYIEGKDYKKLTFENRSIDLDRLEGPKDHIVTGVRFRMLGSHINLEVRITPINYTTGVMQPNSSYWISNDNTSAMARNPRRELQLNSPDDPLKCPGMSKIDSQPDTFMRFVPTDRVKDVAQLTVPFFDSQTVAPAPGTWLSGIELFHKGQPGYGGFLAMKVITYDMTPYMESSSNDPEQ